MDPALRRRLLVAGAIVIVIGAMVAVVAFQPGSSLRTRWELARVRNAEKQATVFLVPGARLRGDATSGWWIGALRPVEPVWRYQVVTLRLLPGCEIVLPSGEKLAVAGSADSTTAAAFRQAANAAMTVSAAEVDRGRELVCRRVIIDVPPYDPIAADLRRGAESADSPPSSKTTVAGRASFERVGASEALLLAIPQRQAEESFAPAERQYALLLPDTLYVAEDGSSLRPTTLEGAKRLILENPRGPVRADLEQRGYGVFVVQLRVRSGQ